MDSVRETENLAKTNVLQAEEEINTYPLSDIICKLRFSGIKRRQPAMYVFFYRIKIIKNNTNNTSLLLSVMPSYFIN